MANDRILTAEQEMKLRQPIDDYIGKIQAQIDGLRKDGTDQVVAIQNTIDGVKRDRSLTKGEREDRLGELRRQLEKAKAVEAKNKDEVSKLIDQGVSYLKEHFDKEYYQPVKESCAQEKVKAKEKYDKKIADLAKMAEPIVSLGNQTGEGWFLTGEMMELIHGGTPNIVCIQPFGCLPNHIVGKGVIKAIRKDYPEANIVAVDYDPGASEVNQLNRIKLMLSTAFKKLG